MPVPYTGNGTKLFISVSACALVPTQAVGAHNADEQEGMFPSTFSCVSETLSPFWMMTSFKMTKGISVILTRYHLIPAYV